MAASTSSPTETIMTITGPQDPAKLPAGPVFCREWLLNNQASLLERAEGDAKPQSDELVELGNLALMRRWPFRSLHNLHLSVEDAARELCGPFRARGSALVVICTPRTYWPQSSPQAYAQ